MPTARRPIEERFWPKAAEPDANGCRLWLAATNGSGYGKVWEPTAATGSQVALAHRVAWWLINGPIPDGAQIDHLCSVTLCVEPSHLEAVTAATNVQRSRGPALTRERYVAARCRRGHAMEWSDRQGRRVCRTCRRDRKRASRARCAPAFAGS